MLISLLVSYLFLFGMFCVVVVVVVVVVFFTSVVHTLLMVTVKSTFDFEPKLEKGMRASNRV